MLNVSMEYNMAPVALILERSGSVAKNAELVNQKGANP